MHVMKIIEISKRNVIGHIVCDTCHDIVLISKTCPPPPHHQQSASKTYYIFLIIEGSKEKFTHNIVEAHSRKNMKCCWLCSAVLLFAFCGLTQALECHKPGECSGGQYIDYIEEVDTYNDCLQLCHADSDANCQWVTYFENKICLHFDNCPNIGQGCRDCFSGERNCPQGKCVLLFK